MLQTGIHATFHAFLQIVLGPAVLPATPHSCRLIIQQKVTLAPPISAVLRYIPSLVCRPSHHSLRLFRPMPLRNSRARRWIDQPSLRQYTCTAGWSSPVARWAHNPKVGGSNPSPATNTSSCPPSHPEVEGIFVFAHQKFLN